MTTAFNADPRTWPPPDASLAGASPDEARASAAAGDADGAVAALRGALEPHAAVLGDLAYAAARLRVFAGEGHHALFTATLAIMLGPLEPRHWMLLADVSKSTGQLENMRSVEHMVGVVWGDGAAAAYHADPAWAGVHAQEREPVAA